MALPLIPLAVSIVPELIRLLAGDRAGAVAQNVAGVVQAVTGTTDPEQARLALADPAKASELRVRLAEIALEGERARLAAEETRRRAELEEIKLSAQNTADARGQLMGLVKENSPLAWGPVAISAIVVLGFFVILLVLIGGHGEFSPQVGAVVNITVGTLGAAFAAVVNFWIGSSQGSRDKDRLVQTMQETQAVQAQTALGTLREVAAAPGIARAAAAAGQRPPDGDARFDRCVAFVLEREGGFSNDPRDPGGATHFGITLKTLAAHREAEVSPAEVEALKREEAIEIYRARFWTPMRCADLPPGIDLMVFDFGVNAGPGRSVRLLQEKAGVTVDGSIGPITLGAVRAAKPDALIAGLAEGRMAHYRSLDTFDRFGRGWTARTDAARAAALAMAGQA